MGEFSVYQFFPDGTSEHIRSHVSPEEAMNVALHYCTSVGARLGTTRRVIITDAGDCTNFEWTFDEGITFPPGRGFGQLKKGLR
jgi:hypothetical protein